MRLLLLEDEPAIRTAMSRAMRRWGHEVTAVSSLAELRDALTKTPADGLISDLKLPDGSGLDAAQDSGLPFVLMSGMATYDDAVRALRLGCVDFFTKPVPMQDLQQALNRLAERSQAGGQRELVAAGSDGLELLHLSPTGTHRHPLAVHRLSWESAAEAVEAFTSQIGDIGSVRQRQLVAELMQLVPSGSLVLNRVDNDWRIWLSCATIDIGEDRRKIIDSCADRLECRADGVLAEGYVAPVRTDTPVGGVSGRRSAVAQEPPAAARWRGELLWPHELQEDRVIDVSHVTALGWWVHGWLQDRPHTALVGLRSDLRRRLQDAGVPALYYRSVSEANERGGVTPSERAMLWE